MSFKPNVFIGSSKESEKYAKAIRQNLRDVANVTVWSQAFLMGQNVIDELQRNLRESDFGVFVFAPDDVSVIRGETKNTVRDNVILELGMFVGKLGKEKSFIISPRNVPDLPSDLRGIVIGIYDEDGTDDVEKALGPCCDDLAKAIAYQIKHSFKELNDVVGNALETVCHAISIPVTPEKAGLRAFIFRKEGDKLVCLHHWDPKKSEEKKGDWFQIDEETAKRVVVVDCVLENRLRRGKPKSTGAKVKPLPKNFAGARGKVKGSLCYVLAVPIHINDKTWGVFDFDTSTAIGQKLLESGEADIVMFQLARQLSWILR